MSVTYTLQPFFLLFFCHLFISCQDPEVIFCTYFTHSHKTLAHEWMFPSFQDDATWVIETGPQVCSEARFFAKGWTTTTAHKVQFIIKTLEEHEGKIVVWVDPDIIFFKPVKQLLIEELNDVDFAGQLDSPEQTMCTGFMAMWSNEPVRAFWKRVYHVMKHNHKLCDQKAFNHVLLKEKNPMNMQWKFLSPNQFFGGGTFDKNTWKIGKTIHIPDDPAMFHANFAFYENKTKLLQHVKDIVEYRKAKI